MTGMTPWIKAPSYDFSSKFFDYASGMIGQPAPRWGGWGNLQQLGQQQNPFAGKGGVDNSMVNLASKYFNLGMPTVFGQAVGGIGRFMNPNFQNPVARLQLGAPNYFGQSAIPSPHAGMPQQSLPWMPQTPQQPPLY